MLHRSTDGGSVWTTLNVDFKSAADLIEDPNDSQIVYLSGTKDVSGQSQFMIWKSTDCGETFPILIPVGSPYGNGNVSAFRIAPSNPSIWYMYGNAFTSGFVPKLFRSEDAGITWTEVMTDLPSYGDELWVSGTDPDYLITAGYNMAFYSENGGENWTAISDLESEYIRAGGIVSHPITGTIYACTYWSGIYKSDDQGLTWTEMNDGLASFSTRNIALDLKNGYIFASTYGGGINRCSIEPMQLWAQFGELDYRGGSVDLNLEASADNAGRDYLILGTTSGTTPGYGLPGGYATLPLNWDLVTDLVATYANTTLFNGFLGVLDSNGHAEAQLISPPLHQGSVGICMHFAYCCNKPFNYVSNPVKIIIVD